MNDLTNSYLKKHEKLLKEENELKEKLQIEVTKVKEKFENFLSELNIEIKISERINKGIKKMENEEKNIIKILSYVSKINKTQKKMKNCLNKIIKSIRFSYEEEKSVINYEEYYLCGIPLIKDIETKNLSYSSIDLSWNIDDIKNFDKDKIKYKVEIKKENEEFNKVYEGNNNNCSLNNLIINTNYEFKICCLYNNLIGEWTEIQKFKTLDLDLDSTILNESNRKNEFLKKLSEWCKFKKIELIFRGSRDGMTANNFHNKCDKQGETITLIKSDKGYIFGGYTSFPWSGDYFYHSSPNSFLFTLTNIHGIQPTKFESKNDNKEVYHLSSTGPIFGGRCDLGKYVDFINDGGWLGFPSTYQDNLWKGKSIFTGDLNNNNKFKLTEIEIFKLSK